MLRGVGDLILEVIEGPDAGKRVVVDKPIVVGRDPQADFVLQDHEVSRRHLQLTPTGDYVTVEDLGSANGTFVNHNELHGPARLDAGDELLAGVSVLQLRDSQQVEARHSAVIAVPQALAMAPRAPAYADPQKVAVDVEGQQSIPELEKYLDVRVRRRAVNAPWLLGALVALVAVAYFATRSTNSIAEGPIAGWVYVEANTPTPNKNAVVAIPYTITGFPVVAKAKQYPTDGSGTPLAVPLPNSVGTTAGDHQVLLSPDHTLLFATNQGSNSIAVFHVDANTGALTPVQGSPFSSLGMAPIALGYSNGTLVVANHGIIAPFNPGAGSPPGPSNLVSFKVSPGGTLTPVSSGGSTPPHPDGAIDANISPDGSTIVSTGFYPEILKLIAGQQPTFGPQLIRSFTLSPMGALAPGGAIPFPPEFTAKLPALAAAGKLPPANILPPFVYPLAFGVAFNPDPNKKLVYVAAAVAGRVAVYDYSNPAALQLKSFGMNPGLAACWLAVSKNGRFLYASNSASQSVSVFSISSDGLTLKLVQMAPLKSKGTTDSLALDPSGKWLYILGNHDDADAPRPEDKITVSGGVGTITHLAPLDANYMDAYKVDPATGKLSEIAAVKLPVPASNVPYGIDVLQKSGQ
jgi:DNA-binding beta-propeller fold protein YncE